MSKEILAILSTVPHETHRYETCGDWQVVDDEKFLITVSSLVPEGLDDSILLQERKQMEMLVGIHELVEAVLCEANGVTDAEVTAWDKAHIDDCEPGAIPNCPYYTEHLIASIVERIVASALQIDWNEYESVLEAL